MGIEFILWVSELIFWVFELIFWVFELILLVFELILWVSGRGDGGDDGGGGGDVPTILPSGQSPDPSCTGTKYPVRESLTSIKSIENHSNAMKVKISI